MSDGYPSLKALTAAQWAWLTRLHDDPNVGATAFSVGFGICRSINGKTGFAFPGQARLGEWAGVGERQARGLIRQLEAAGYLIVQSGGFQKPDRYWITLPDRKSTAALRPETDCRSDALPDRKSSVSVTGNALPPNCSRELTEKSPSDSPSPELPLGVPATISPLKPSGIEEDFAAWWAIYPRRAGKKAARQAYERARKGGATAEQLAEGASAYAGERAGKEATYTKHAATWLNGEHWHDEPAGAAPMQSRSALDLARSIIGDEYP